LVNISRNGALIVAENPPPLATPTLLRIESPVKTDWADAIVVRLDQNRRIGLQFTRSCADDLLLAGTVGIDLASMIRGGAHGTTAFD